jgi:hypothetical protein
VATSALTNTMSNKCRWSPPAVKCWQSNPMTGEWWVMTQCMLQGCVDQPAVLLPFCQRLDPNLLQLLVPEVLTLNSKLLYCLPKLLLCQVLVYSCDPDMRLQLRC